MNAVVEPTDSFKCPLNENTSPVFNHNTESKWREDTENNVKTCNYCGSINQDQFMQLVEEGKISLGATDKNYKVYCHLENGKQLKFYFQHLSEEQRKKFVDLYNERKIKFQGSGFYVFPFFMIPKE